MTISNTALRKAPIGTQVYLIKAPFVRFVRGEDRQWHEVPRMGIEPTIRTASELFELGVALVPVSE